MPEVGINIWIASTWTPVSTNGELRESQPNLITYAVPTGCRTSSWCHVRKASEWHHDRLYLSRGVMTPGTRQDSRIRCHIWAMYFLLRAYLCRFRHGIYLHSFMYLLNKWLFNTCYCPLLKLELREPRLWSCLPVSYTLVGGVGKHVGTLKVSDSSWVMGKFRCFESIWGV